MHKITKYLCLYFIDLHKNNPIQGPKGQDGDVGPKGEAGLSPEAERGERGGTEAGDPGPDADKGMVTSVLVSSLSCFNLVKFRITSVKFSFSYLCEVFQLLICPDKLAEI